MTYLPPHALPASWIAGCDEVGRGPLAGPVVASVVWCTLSEDLDLQNIQQQLKSLAKLGVTDSKKLTTRKRQNILASLQIDLNAEMPFPILSIGKNWQGIICEVSHTEIDKINILNASLKAMSEGVKNGPLSLKGNKGAGTLLIDGNQKLRESFKSVQQIPIVKGDQKSLIIALSSIIAKEYRDQLMIRMGQLYPGYGFENHAGYPTATHCDFVANNGPCPIHRLTFKGVREYVTATTSG